MGDWRGVTTQCQDFEGCIGISGTCLLVFKISGIDIIEAEERKKVKSFIESIFTNVGVLDTGA